MVRLARIRGTNCEFRNSCLPSLCDVESHAIEKGFKMASCSLGKDLTILSNYKVFIKTLDGMILQPLLENIPMIEKI